EHTRARAEETVAVCLADEMLEHLLRDGEVGDDAVLQWSNGGDVARGATEHALGIGTDRLDDLATTTWLLTDGDDRRLIQNADLAAHVWKGIGGRQVDGQGGGNEVA